MLWIIVIYSRIQNILDYNESMYLELSAIMSNNKPNKGLIQRNTGLWGWSSLLGACIVIEECLANHTQFSKDQDIIKSMKKNIAYHFDDKGVTKVIYLDQYTNISAYEYSQYFDNLLYNIEVLKDILYVHAHTQGEVMVLKDTYNISDDIYTEQNIWLHSLTFSDNDQTHENTDFSEQGQQIQANVWGAAAITAVVGVSAWFFSSSSSSPSQSESPSPSPSPISSSSPVVPPSFFPALHSLSSSNDEGIVAKSVVIEELPEQEPKIEEDNTKTYIADSELVEQIIRNDYVSRDSEEDVFLYLKKIIEYLENKSLLREEDMFLLEGSVFEENSVQYAVDINYDEIEDAIIYNYKNNQLLCIDGVAVEKIVKDIPLALYIKDIASQPLNEIILNDRLYVADGLKALYEECVRFIS